VISVGGDLASSRGAARRGKRRDVNQKS